MVSRRHGGEEGSATVTGVAVTLGLVALATVVGYGATGLVQQHRATAAADLTALSAATVLLADGAESACATAATVAADNYGATVTDCRTVVAGGPEVPDAPASSRGEEGITVTVTVGDRRATAVAGP